MNTSELQTKYYLETSRESVDEKGDFTDHYVAWLQDIIIGRNKVKNLAQRDVIKSLSDLDGKTIPVRFTVKKWQPNIHLDDI